MRPIPIICGPTGSGKTAVAVELARQFKIEIISADSRQIIRHLDIGTAKPTIAEREMVDFHLIDIIEPGQRYSAVRFIGDAGRAIEQILSRNSLPVIVGGTGLYLRALTEGVIEIESDDYHIREKLEADWEKDGPEVMYDRLERIDPLEAAKIHKNNRPRIIRALEMFELTGKSKSELIEKGTYKKSKHDFKYFSLIPQRAELYETINNRTDEMMTGGWLDEVKRLIEEGRQEEITRANVIGYKELLAYLDKSIELDEAISLIKQNSRRYAKRQITWFRHQINSEIYSTKAELLAALTLFFEKSCPGDLQKT